VIEDPYLYPGTDCLRNRLGIRNADELKRAEGERTAVTLALLERDPIPGQYDLPHLRAFHRRIFGDIYDWAGKLRTVTIAKEHSVFALPEHIESFLTGARTVAREQHLRNLEREQFLERLTHSHAEINAAHPFREGNGRTQRAFLSQLAHQAGHHLAWEQLNPKRNTQAARSSHQGDNQPLHELLDTLLEPRGEPRTDRPER
jgi:cell filamentation protein